VGAGGEFGVTFDGEKKAVDPLSLSLTFEKTSDERVELALNELKEHFPW
jgi:hypothetical protein